jgi:hypothetical protein
LIPDWNSLDSVRHVHSDLEAAALVFFALLVLFDILAHLSTDNKKKTLLEKIGLCCFAIAVLAEVVAYPYGQRNDTLSGQIIGSLDAETREALIKSGTALAQSREADTKSGDAIDKTGNALGIANDAKQVSREARQEADSFEQDIMSAKENAAKAEERTLRAEQALLQFQEKLLPRHLSEKQKQDLVQRLSGQPKVPVMVGWANDATDGQIYGEDFRDVFKRLGWDPDSTHWQLEWLSKHTIGVFVVVHDPNDDVAPEATAFGAALIAVGVPAKPGVDAGIPQHSFEIRIGAKE